VNSYNEITFYPLIFKNTSLGIGGNFIFFNGLMVIKRFLMVYSSKNKNKTIEQRVFFLYFRLLEYNKKELYALKKHENK